MRPRLWTVGLLGDGDPVVLGPFSRRTAEEMFARLNRDCPAGMRPFIQPLTRRKGAEPWLIP